MGVTIEYRRAARRGGPYYHAVPAGEPAAVCGHEPQRGGWSAETGDTATCPACRRKLGMGPIPPPRAEGGAR